MSSNTPPCVTLYTYDTELTPESVLGVTTIIEQLLAKGIPKSFIQIQPLSNNRELAKQVLEKAGECVSWPLVFVNGNPIGDLDKWLEEVDFSIASSENVSSGMFTSLDESFSQFSPFEDLDIRLDSEATSIIEAEDLLSLSSLTESEGSAQSFPSISDFEFSDDGKESKVVQSGTKSDALPVPSPLDQEVGLGYMGQTLEGLERGVVGISSYMRSAMNLVGLSPTDASLSAIYVDQGEDEMENRKAIAEFKVIQTNWYYRQQTRILRFFPSCFVRLHPISDAVRTVHSYKDIKKITCFGGSVLTLDFVDDNQEYYQSPVAKEIIELLQKKAKEKGHSFLLVSED